MSILRTLLLVTMAAGVAFVAQSDSAFAAGNVITTTATFASDSSLALDAEGNPVIAYGGETNGDLKLLRCDDPDCSPGGDITTTLDPLANGGGNSALTLDASGFPAISYDTSPDLKLVRCGAANCAPVVGGLSELASVSAGAADESFLTTWLTLAVGATATVIAIAVIAFLGRSTKR